MRSLLRVLLGASLVVSACLPTDTPPVVESGAVADEGELGISPGAELLSMAPVELDDAMATIVDLGATWVRVDIPWPAVQATPTSWDFTDEDRVIEAAVANGLEVVAVAGYRPAWATTSDGGVDADAYAAFIGTAVARYTGRVDAWELWNEPNLAGAWGGPASPEDYAALVVAANRAAGDADPDSYIITGGLSPATDAEGNRAPVGFVEDMYAAGAGGSFDAVGLHPYGYPAFPDDPATSEWNTWFRLPDVLHVLDRNGDEGMDVWITEFGAPTGTSGQAVSDARQADIVERGIAQWRELSRVGPLFVYSLRDRGPDLSDREENFGLLRHDGTEKPSFQRFADAARP